MSICMVIAPCASCYRGAIRDKVRPNQSHEPERAGRGEVWVAVRGREDGMVICEGRCRAGKRCSLS